MLHIASGCVVYYGSQTESELIEDRPNLAIELYMDEVSPVHPGTVGQFTGLYDREGNEIFEGDVVTGLEYADFHTGDDGNVNAVVVWDTEWASFMLDAGCRVNIRPCADIRRRIRVTGNIHDNPSLLEGGLKCFTL